MFKDRPRETSPSISCEVDRAPDAQALRACPGCRTELDLHQPDLDHPNRLLGTCPGCGTWFIIDEAPKSNEVLRVRVPAAPVVVKAMGGRTRSRPTENLSGLDSGSTPLVAPRLHSR